MAEVAVPHLPADAPRVSEGRYVLLTRLGEGGMAVVYGAWDQDLRIWRAVKVLLPEYARKGSVRRRFDREAQTMMSVRHPNLVRVVEVQADRALPYMVMDLVPGGSLQEWALRNGSMPPRLAVGAALDICRGLQAVHDAGIVHRDIKPQNVLVELDGTCKLTDFGVARVDGGDTKTGVAMGTLGYMAPEQLADSKSVDVRSDVYSVGATLYVLMTRATVRDLFRVADDPHKIEGVPDELVAVVRKCLQYEREDRWPDVASLVAALEQSVPMLPPLPEGTPPLPRGPRDGIPGMPAGEFTELSGLMGDTNPTFTEDQSELGATPASTATPAAPEVVVVQAPRPRPAPPARRRRSALGPLLLGGVVVSFLAVLLVLVTLPTVLGLGTSRVREAAEAHAGAEAVLLARMEDADLVLRALEGHETDTSRARDALDHFHAHPDAASALATVDALSSDVRRLGKEGHAEQVARQKAEALEWAATNLREATSAWDAAARSPMGGIAIAAGLAERPPQSEGGSQPSR